MDTLTTTPKSLLEAHDLTVRFGDVTVIENISFSVTEGSFVGLIGPNGAGKSTLLRTLLGLVKPSSGSYQFAPDAVIRYVPQQYTLPSNIPISVAEVIRMGTREQIHTTAMVSALSHVELGEEFLRKNYHHLSGGQKQRVMIARALVVQPDIILFDEPLSGVDLATKTYIHDVLKELNRAGTTIFFVSHDVGHVVDVCDLVLCLDTSLHRGCHPVAFAHGDRDSDTDQDVKSECLVGGHTPPDKAPVHHHH